MKSNGPQSQYKNPCFRPKVVKWLATKGELDIGHKPGPNVSVFAAVVC